MYFESATFTCFSLSLCCGCPTAVDEVRKKKVAGLAGRPKSVRAWPQSVDVDFLRRRPGRSSGRVLLLVDRTVRAAEDGVSTATWSKDVKKDSKGMPFGRPRQPGAEALWDSLHRMWWADGMFRRNGSGAPEQLPKGQLRVDSGAPKASQSPILGRVPVADHEVVQSRLANASRPRKKLSEGGSRLARRWCDSKAASNWCGPYGDSLRLKVMKLLDEQDLWQLDFCI